MNKNDCVQIGLLLVFSKSAEELREGLLKMDPRIEPEMELFLEVKGDDAATTSRYEALMADEYGEGWIWSPRVREENRQKEIYEQARKDIRNRS